MEAIYSSSDYDSEDEKTQEAGTGEVWKGGRSGIGNGWKQSIELEYLYILLCDQTKTV